MVSERAVRYTEISQYLIEEARHQLERGDLIQASEKCWGAVAHAVKSVAQARGWNHHRHDLLRDVVNQVVEERERRDLLTLFSSASDMHQNFYEHELYTQEVQVGIDNAKTLIGDLDALRDAPTPPFVPQTAEHRRRLRKLTRDPVPLEEDISNLPPVRPEPPGEQ